jgi:hypothetical protein
MGINGNSYFSGGNPPPTPHTAPAPAMPSLTLNQLNRMKDDTKSRCYRNGDHHNHPHPQIGLLLLPGEDHSAALFISLQPKDVRLVSASTPTVSYLAHVELISRLPLF